MNDLIDMYFHCRKCLEEKHHTISVKDYCRISVGKNKAGIQMWCDRHDMEIAFFPYDWKNSPVKICKCELCNGNE
jgi:hypothetical protein